MMNIDAEGRGMDGDDRPEPGLIVGTEDHLLVAIPIDVLEHVHNGSHLLCLRWGQIVFLMVPPPE